jgi:hypothetical protein
MSVLSSHRSTNRSRHSNASKASVKSEDISNSDDSDDYYGAEDWDSMDEE